MDRYFSTKQISQMTGTNEETVRRWLRNGELKGTHDSLKKGYRVLESDLNIFLDNNPKYRTRALNSNMRRSFSDITIYNDAKTVLNTINEQIKETVKAIDPLQQKLESLYVNKAFYEDLLKRMEELGIS